MLKKTITYTDFNGEETTEDFYFHLSQAELVEMELSHQGGLSESLQKIIVAEDGKQIIAMFKEIILGAYGQRSVDGKRFVKNQQLREEFESSEAYSTLFMEIVTDTGKAIDFINGIVPQDLAAKMANLPQNQLGVKPPLQVADGALTVGEVKQIDTTPGFPPAPAAEPVQPTAPSREVITQAAYYAMTAQEKAIADAKIERGEARLLVP